jgi:DNA-binding NtrC family response regulator
MMPEKIIPLVAKKTLLIELNEGDACQIEDLLTQEGVDVVRAEGGKEAFEILSREEFPMIITNIEMPDIDGYSIIEFLKKKKKDSLVIVMTDHASIDSVIVALRLGAYDYIIKPFSAEFFRHTVMKAFEFIMMRENRVRQSQTGLVSELATTMSHEVFQPLTVLMGLAHEIQRASTDKNIRDMAGEILSESRKIRDLIRKMNSLDPYATKEFPGGHVIIDIQGGSKK